MEFNAGRGKSMQVIGRAEEQPNKLVFILWNILKQVKKRQETLYLDFMNLRN